MSIVQGDDGKLFFVDNEGVRSPLLSVLAADIPSAEVPSDEQDTSDLDTLIGQLQTELDFVSGSANTLTLARTKVTLRVLARAVLTALRLLKRRSLV